jgi:hypothetical protein
MAAPSVGQAFQATSPLQVDLSFRAMSADQATTRTRFPDTGRQPVCHGMAAEMPCQIVEHGEGHASAADAKGSAVMQAIE